MSSVVCIGEPVEANFERTIRQPPYATGEKKIKVYVYQCWLDVPIRSVTDVHNTCGPINKSMYRIGP